MREFQFGLADILCTTLAVSLVIGWLLRLSESPGNYWLIVVLALICAGVGIACSHVIYSDARYRGGTGTAIWTTLLGVVIGTAGAPIILIALPLAILLSILVAILLTVELTLQYAAKRLEILFGMTKKSMETDQKSSSQTSE